MDLFSLLPSEKAGYTPALRPDDYDFVVTAPSRLREKRLMKIRQTLA